MVSSDEGRTAMAAATGVDAGVSATDENSPAVAAGTGVRIDVDESLIEDDAAGVGGA